MTRPALPMVLTAWIVSCTAVAAHAQNARGTLDVGSSIIRYADSISVSAIVISPAFRITGRAGSLGGAGTLARASDFSSGSGTVYGALASPATRPLSIEVGGSAGGSTHGDRTRTGQMLGTARLYWNAPGRGAWAGAGLGRTWDGEIWRAVEQGSAGAWISSGTGSAVVSISPTVVDDTITYTDALVTLHRPVGVLELTGSLGARLGDPVPSLVTDRAWASASIAMWLGTSVAVVASGGTYPVDFTQGFPGGKFLTIGLRFSTPRAMPAAPATTDASRSAGVLAFALRVSGARQELRVRAPSASTVEVAGDFTNWMPVRLAADEDGWWSVSRDIPRGTHQISVRVNGGEWVAPPGLVAVRDEFGGSSGVLVVK